MKQKDITLIIVVGVVSVITAFLISNFFFGSPENRQLEAEVVDPITAEFNLPSDQYFNENSIDPTETIRIGETGNQTPFKTE